MLKTITIDLIKKNYLKVIFILSIMTQYLLFGPKQDKWFGFSKLLHSSVNVIVRQGIWNPFQFHHGRRSRLSHLNLMVNVQDIK